MKKSIIIIISLVLISCNNQSKKRDVQKNITQTNSDFKEAYYDNGALKTRAKLKNGIENGSYLAFYPNKLIAESGIKIKGKMNDLWKFYDSIGHISSVKHYYNDKPIYNLDINDFDYQEKKIDEYLVIQIPKKWNVIKSINTKQVLLSIRKNCGKQISFCPNLTVTIDHNIYSKKEIETYLNQSNKALETKFNNYKIIKERKFIHEGIIYFEKIYKGTIQDIKIGGITTWIFDNQKTYIITGLALNEKDNSFLKNEGLFKDITNNIKIN